MYLAVGTLLVLVTTKNAQGNGDAIQCERLTSEQQVEALEQYAHWYGLVEPNGEGERLPRSKNTIRHGGR